MALFAACPRRLSPWEGLPEGGCFPFAAVPPPPGLDYNPRRAAGRAEPPPLPPSSAGAGAGAEGSGAEGVPRLVSGAGIRTDRGDTCGEPSDRLGQESVHLLRTRADRHRLRALLLRAGGAAGARAGPRVCRVTLGEAPALGISGCQSMAALPGRKGHPSASSRRPWEKHRPLQHPRPGGNFSPRGPTGPSLHGPTHGAQSGPSSLSPEIFTEDS